MKAKGKANAAGALLVILALGTIVGMVPATWAQTPTGLSGSLTIAGSTTVLPINQECARLLMAANPDLRISVSGGGSGHGVKAAGTGEIDIGAVSRDVKSSELAQYPDLKPVAIGKDSVAIVVHPSNSISGLTLEQTAKIFSGEITNWKEVGGADAAIRVITREAGSGTRETFETYVMTPLKKEIAAQAFVKASNGEVRATVSSDSSSIGYLSLGYVDDTIKALSISGIAATVESVVAGTYPISRNLYLLTNGEPSTLEAAFINFVLSSEGQKVVEDMGYIQLVKEEPVIPTGLSGSLTIAGSTTVLPINQECARLLTEANPDLRISVSGGGSGHGVKAAGAGEIDIGAVSRDVKSSELEQYPDLKPVAIGKDSVAIIVHPSNSISGLTLEQTAKIFSGEITNWKEVGGADATIRVITREAGSGTRETFETYVMTPQKKEIAAQAFVKASNGEVRATVSSDSVSIGYLSLGYVDETIKALSMGGIAATVENVIVGKYPISRNLYLLTKGTPSALEQAFINFVLSSEGQKVVEEMGYIEIGEMVTPSPPTPMPTALTTATPTLTPAGTPTPVATLSPTPIPTPKEPGFEAVTVIAGLLAVSYLAVRIRRGSKK